MRPEKRILLVVMTADRGLAGGFNANLIKLAQRFVDDHRADDLSFMLVGKKGRDYFRRRTKSIRGEHTDLFRNVRLEDAEKIANAVIDLFSKAEIDAVYLFGNEFKSVVAPNITGTRILPIELPKSPATVDYIYEQKPEELLGSLLPRYVKLQIFRALSGIGGSRACRAHDGDGRSHLQRLRRDRPADTVYESSPSSQYHARDYRDCERRSSAGLSGKRSGQWGPGFA